MYCQCPTHPPCHYRQRPDGNLRPRAPFDRVGAPAKKADSVRMIISCGVLEGESRWRCTDCYCNGYRQQCQRGAPRLIHSTCGIARSTKATAPVRGIAVAVAIIDSTQEKPTAKSLLSAGDVGRKVSAPPETGRAERRHRHRPRLARARSPRRPTSPSHRESPPSGRNTRAPFSCSCSTTWCVQRSTIPIG